MDAALITGGTAIATGLLGYAGARLQHRAEVGRLALDRNRVDLERGRLEKDLEEARTQRLEQTVEAKRLLYCEYLRNAEVSWSLCSRHNMVAESEVDEWWVGYQGVRRQLMMAASEDVVEKAQAINDHIAKLFVDLIQAIRDAANDEDAHGKRIGVWQQHYENVESALRQLEAAMRADAAM